MADIPNFGDLVTTAIALDGEKKKLDDVLDKSIIVTGARITTSKYSHSGTENCVTIQFYYEDDPNEERFILFTGSGVICEQVQEILSKMESEDREVLFRTTIKKCGKYHALT